MFVRRSTYLTVNSLTVGTNSLYNDTTRLVAGLRRNFAKIISDGHRDL